METVFYVLLRCWTPKGCEKFGRFELGFDSEFAYTIFSELEGTTEAQESDSITMELVETKGGLPVNLKIISCTLDQLGFNCRQLTKEIFKQSIHK